MYTVFALGEIGQLVCTLTMRFTFPCLAIMIVYCFVILLLHFFLGSPQFIFSANILENPLIFRSLLDCHIKLGPDQKLGKATSWLFQLT